MQRRAIRGADLKPNPSQHASLLNAEKCVIYLRGIGVEIDDKTADEWLDTQAAFRFFRSERKAVRTVTLWACRCGAMRGYAETGRKRLRLPKDVTDGLLRKRPKCAACGTGFCCSSLRFYVCRDGTVQDYRTGVDAVIPLRLDEWAGGL